jgi:hypothetical protein
LAGLSPPGKTIYIEQAKGTNPYLRIYKAIAAIESKNDSTAYNERENACGMLQIRSVLIQDYNQQTGQSFKLQNMFRPDSSKIVFMHYATKWHYNQVEQISRTWNGGQSGMSKKTTIAYYHKVDSILNLSKLE